MKSSRQLLANCRPQVWYGRGESNPYSEEPEPKSGASASSATAAYKFSIAQIMVGTQP